jgi:hypothetical protein
VATLSGWLAPYRRQGGWHPIGGVFEFDDGDGQAVEVDHQVGAVGLKVLAGQGASIDTTTPGGKLTFGIFAALAEV